MVAGDFSDVLKTLKSPKQVPGMEGSGVWPQQLIDIEGIIANSAL